MVLKAPSINGTDAHRLNNAEIQVLLDGKWVPIGMVTGMNDRDSKLFDLKGSISTSLRLSHSKIDGGFCLGVGLARFNVPSKLDAKTRAISDI